MRLLGLPFVRGGIVEVGGSPNLIDEAEIYQVMPLASYGDSKDDMRRSAYRDRAIACQRFSKKPRRE